MSFNLLFASPCFPLPNSISFCPASTYIISFIFNPLFIFVLLDQCNSLLYPLLPLHPALLFSTFFKFLMPIFLLSFHFLQLPFLGFISESFCLSLTCSSLRCSLYRLVGIFCSFHCVQCNWFFINSTIFLHSSLHTLKAGYSFFLHGHIMFCNYLFVGA